MFIVPIATAQADFLPPVWKKIILSPLVKAAPIVQKIFVGHATNATNLKLQNLLDSIPTPENQLRFSIQIWNAGLITSHFRKMER